MQSENTLQPYKVAKFGGTSLASVSQIQKVQEIIISDPSIRYVVVSAPGKRHAEDIKMTDSLIAWYKMAQLGGGTDCQQRIFSMRFNEIADTFNCMYEEIAFSDWLNTNIRALVCRFRNIDTTDAFDESRGEYMIAKLMAAVLDWEFVDATELIIFNNDGTCQWNLSFSKIYERLQLSMCKKGGFVIPGFYGAYFDNRTVMTFSRGGSDISGALIAAGVRACEYQNWTDTNGLTVVDPGLVPEAATIVHMSYEEAREAAYMGMRAIHPQALYPTAKFCIPTRVLNTNNPSHAGTVISDDGESKNTSPITIVTGKKGFSVIRLSKALMNEELGFGHLVTGVLLEYGISFDYMPGGVDTLSVVIDQEKVSIETIDKCASRCADITMSDQCSTEHDIAMISVVGAGMVHQPGMAARVIAALANAGVNIRLISQGGSEINITLGVRAENMERVVIAIYSEFFHPFAQVMYSR